MALNYTNGYMAHHAVFLASRHYLVNDTQVGSRTDETQRDSDAEKTAKAVFSKYFPDGLAIGARAGNLIFNNPNQMATKALTVFVGISYEFKQRFSLGLIGGKDDVSFRTESFLGREPTRFEGYVQTCEAIKEVTGGNDCTVNDIITIDDNGG